MELLPGPFEVQKHENPASAEYGQGLSLIPLESKPLPDSPAAAISPSSGFRPTVVFSLPPGRKRPRMMVPIAAGTECEKEESDEDAPFRDFDCPNYNKCLSLAATLDWGSFSCTGCNQTINEQLIWRAQHRLRSDPYLAQLFNFPPLSAPHRPHP